MFSSIVSRLIILLFGTLYPAYASYKAVRTKNVKEYVKWMMYWIVFALFTCAETFTDIFLCWFPFYYEIKIVMVLWLLSPATKGSSILYRKFVHPTLARRENEIDECIAKAREQGCRAVLNLGSKGVNYATTVIMQTAIKGGGGLVNQLKKSYSLSDLSCEEDGTMAITASSISKKEEVDGPTGVVLRSRRPRSTHDDVVRSVEDITAEEVPVFTRTSSVGSTTRTRSRLTGSTRRQPTAEEAEMLLQLLTSIPNFNLNNLLDVDQGEENTENVDVPIETNSNLNIEQTLNENTETCEEKKNEIIIENESCNINENIDKEIKQEIEVPKSNDIEETNNTESSSSIVEQNISEKISEKDNVSEPKEIPIETKTSNDLPVDDNTINDVPTQVEAKDNLKDISKESIPSSSFIPTCVHQFENGCDSSNELDKEIVATTNTNSDTQLKDKRGGKYGKKAAPLRPDEVVLKSTENDSSKKKLSSKSFKDRSGSLTKIVNLPQKLLFWGHKKLHFSSSLIGIDSLDLDFDAMKRSKSEQNLNNCEKHN